MVTNTELTIDQITYEALVILKNKLALGNRCLRQFDKSFGETGAKIGDTLRVRVPARYQTATGPAFVQQAFQETYVPVAAQTQRQLGLSFGTAEMKLAIDDFSERVLAPGLVQMASDIDTDGTKVATSGYSIVNNGYVTANYAGTYAGFGWLVTPGALVNGNQPANWTGASIGSGTIGGQATAQANAASPFFNAQAVLDNASAPQNDRYCVVSPQASAQLATNLFTLFNPSNVVTDMFEEGMISSDFAGAKFFRSPSIVQTTSGTWNSAGVNVAAQVVTGASAIALGNIGNAAIVNSGDQFVVNGVYSVNPVTRISTGQLQIFTAVGQATANAAGNVTVSVYPPIANAGAYQTVTALPAPGVNNVTFIGTANTSTYANFYYQKDAIALVVAPLDEDLDGAAVSNTKSRADSEEDGLSIRFVSQYNASTDQKIKRLDILYGWAVVRPSLGVLVKG